MPKQFHDRHFPVRPNLDQLKHQAKDLLRAVREGDADAVHSGLAALGFFAADDPRFDPERVLDHVQALNRWYASDEALTLTPEYVSALLADAGDPRSRYWELMKNETMPSDSLFSNRMQGMTLAAIGQLRATGNWHRIMLEWLYGATPFSSLGLAEAEFFGAARARAA